MKNLTVCVTALSLAGVAVLEVGAARPTQGELALARQWTTAYWQPVRGLPDAAL